MRKSLLMFIIMSFSILFFSSPQEVFSSGHVVRQTEEFNVTGGSEYIIVENDIEDYLRDKFTSTDYEYVSMKKKTSSVLTGVENASQYALNSAYYKQRDLEVTGTCANVAVAILIDYYNRSGKLGRRYNLTIEDWFIKTMDIGLANNLTTPTDGTYISKVDQIVTKVLNSVNEDFSGNNDYYYIKASIRSVSKDKAPIILHIPGHSTVAKGYVTYEVKVNERYWSWFSYKWRTVTKTVEFAVISEGWGWTQNAYYDMELINDSFPNFGPYAMTKIK